MQMQQYNVENLLCNYLERFLIEYPFLKVRVEDSEVIISVGSEDDNEDKSSIHQVFLEWEKYYLKTDIKTLEKIFTII